MREEWLKNREKPRKRPEPRIKIDEQLKILIAGHKEEIVNGDLIAVTIMGSERRATKIHINIVECDRDTDVYIVFHVNNKDISSVIRIKAKQGNNSMNYQYYFNIGDNVSATVEYDGAVSPKGVWLKVEGY